MKIKDIIRFLKKKDQDKEVNYIVVGLDGEIVSMHLDGDYFDVLKVCRSFVLLKPPPPR